MKGIAPSSPVRNVVSPKRGAKFAGDSPLTPTKSRARISDEKSTPPRRTSKFGDIKSPFGRDSGIVTPNKSPAALSRIFIGPKVRKVYSLVTKRNQLGGNGTTGAIYGELTAGSMQKVINIMIKKCGLTHESRVIDVGAGLGKPNLHFAQDPACRLSMGVELEEIRWKLSMFILDGILPEMADGLKQAHSHVIKKPPSKPEVSDSGSESEDREEDEPLYPGVNFVHGDIDDAASTDPFTHIYMYDLGFPPDLQRSIARKFNNSVHATTLVSYRPPHRVLHEYGYEVELVDEINTTMFGSGENHKAYFYKRTNRGGVPELKGAAPFGCTKVLIKARPGFDEEDVNVAVADCYVPAVRAAVGKVTKLASDTHALVQAHMNEGRPKRNRKLSAKALSHVGGQV